MNPKIYVNFDNKNKVIIVSDGEGVIFARVKYSSYELYTDDNYIKNLIKKNVHNKADPSTLY
jgi:hypothetical protein